MKRIISLVLVFTLLMSSGLLDVMAWAAENSRDSRPVSEQTAPMEELGEFSFEFEPQAEPVVDEKTGLEYVRLNNVYCEITGYTGDAADLEIPETLGGYTVRSIGEEAFYWNEDLESVTLPETVERIQSYAFCDCSYLEEINIPDGVVELGERAFAGCSRLREFHFPSKLERAGNAVWAGCSDLETIEIPEGITELQDYLFAQSAIRELKLPDSLQKLGDCVFSSCEELEEIVIPDSVTEIGCYLFEYCYALESVTLPGDLEILPEGIFRDCDSLEQIQLPEGLTEIHYEAFAYCDRLRTLELPDSIWFIGGRAFADCWNLEQINYPLSLTTTEEGIFSGCTNLETITVPEGVTWLPDRIFADCNALQQIELPDSLERIGAYAFYNCDSLEEMELPDSLAELGDGAFAYCSELERIVIPEGIRIIAPNTFDSCTRLAQVELPDGLKRIEDYAFVFCEDLETIHIPDSVEFLGSNAFDSCGRLYQINYPLSLEETGGDVFWNCWDLETITVPEGVEHLPEGVFSGCNELEAVILPDSLTSIGAYAFSNCSDLETIDLPEGLTELGDNAFECCSSLREITIPDSITVLPEGLFYECSRLHSVVLPEGLTELGSYSFDCCRNLVSILLPESLETIGEYCFGGCEKLSAILLPEGLCYIGWGAFSECRSLTEITIPDSVTEIEEDAFWGIEDLVICCRLNSHAAAYAIEHGIAIAELSGDVLSDLYELDTSRSAYQINYDGLSASGNLSMDLRYSFKDRSWASPRQVVISIPASCQLLEHTLTLNGGLCSDYTYDYYEGYDGVLYIPVEDSEGVIRFSIKPMSYEKITSYAKVEFVDENDSYRAEVVGVVYADLPIITLTAKEETSESTITVSGVTMPENTVSFTINGEAAGEAKANRVGNYEAELTLPDPSDGKRYTIQAQTMDADGNLITAETLVIYQSGTPVITNFVMHHSGQTYGMEDMEGVRPVVTFVPGETFRFEVYVDQHESIESLFIVSTRSNQRKTMEARWDESLGAYVAEGLFDPDDENYVPGSITIEYVRRNEKVSFLTGYDFTSQESINMVPEDWKDADVTVNEDSENRHDVTIEKSDGSVSLQVITTREDIPDGINQDNAAEHGFVRIEDDYGNPAWVRYHEDNGVPQIDIVDWTDEVMVSQFLEMGGDLVGIPGGFFTAMDVISAFGESVSHDLQFQQMRNEIINSNMSWAEKSAALDQLDNAQKINAMLGITRMAGTVVCAAVGAAFLGPVGGLILSVGWGLVDHYLGYLQEKNLYYMGSKSLWELIFGWVIDPSGYVYDQATGQRLSGVTVSAYWVPYDDSVDNFWGAVPGDSEYGEFWDASAYSQMNPLVTDEEGRYAWDVPEGWWRVEYQMEGYETTWSEWMPVPPPQTEVNIGLIASDPDHTHSYEPEITDPTCTERGFTTYTCECGESYVDDYTDALGHDWDEGVVTVEPTEGEEGEMLYTCLRCEDTRTEILPVVDHVHSYEAEVTDPTCTEPGYTTYTCECGESYEDDYTEALGHDWGEWYVAEDPTCTESGIERRDCFRCDATEEQELEAAGHSYEAEVTAPTCTEQGYTTYTCECGESYEDDYTDALGHDWDEGVVIVEPTEDSKGQMCYTCLRCGGTRIEEIPELDHVHSHEPSVTAPTCTERGYTTYTCRCGDSYVADYTDALGHDLGAWYIVTAPTCTESGTERRDCSRCDYAENRTVDATGHSHEPVVTAPTCTEAGFTTYTCACGHSYISNYVDALGHDYVDGTCTRCGAEDLNYQEPVNPFTDVPEGAFYFDPVLWAVENGVTTGASATTFNPNGECQRAHVVTFLWRAAGKPEPASTENPFVDVKETDFYYKAVLWAVENGVTNGLDATHFGPFAYCNRAQVVTFLYRAMGNPAVSSTECPFTDVTAGAWFEAPILWAVENGITNGMGGGLFGVGSICNRAQVVTFLYRTYVNE